MCFLTAGSLPASSSAQSNGQLTSPAVDHLVTSGPAQSVQEIQELRDRYHKAVVGHDGSGLLQLVLPQASLWVTLLAEQPFRDLKQVKPETQKVHA